MDKVTEKLIRFLKRNGVKAYTNNIGTGISVEFFPKEQELLDPFFKRDRPTTSEDTENVQEIIKRKKKEQAELDRSKQIPHEIQKVNELFQAAGLIAPKE